MRSRSTICSALAPSLMSARRKEIPIRPTSKDDGFTFDGRRKHRRPRHPAWRFGPRPRAEPSISGQSPARASPKPRTTVQLLDLESSPLMPLLVRTTHKRGGRQLITRSMISSTGSVGLAATVRAVRMLVGPDQSRHHELTLDQSSNLFCHAVSFDPTPPTKVGSLDRRSRPLASWERTLSQPLTQSPRRKTVITIVARDGRSLFRANAVSAPGMGLAAPAG